MSDKASEPTAGAIPPTTAQGDTSAEVPNAIDAKASDALAIAGRAHERLDGWAERINDLEDKVDALAERGIGLAETGAFGTDAKAGASITQEIIDFLHHLFPGHGAPGTPSTAPVAEPAPKPAP